MHMQRLARSAWLRGPQALAAAALVAGLAACGHAAPPDPGAEAADATAAGTWGDMKRNDPLRPPPAGTLHYTVELTGDVHKTGPHAGERRDARIRRRIEVTSRMQGVLVNGDLGAANPDRSNPDRPRDNHPAQPPKTIIDDLSRQAAACKGDSACMMKISMKLAADSKAQEEIQRVGNQQMAMIGRTVVWSRRAPCDGRATIDDSDDSARWGEDVGEGYHETGLDKRKTVARAGTSFDCRPNLLSDDPAVADHLIADGTLIYLDQQTGTYDIVIAPEQVDAATTVNDTPGTPKKTGTPKIALSGFEGAAIDKPISGSKTVEVARENGVPLHADVRWTFTPDRP